MTVTPVILKAKPLPTGRQVKDPSAFSIVRLSLLWMGFFTDAQNDTFTDVILNAVKDPSAFSIV
jgi:hypothetical protein